MINPRPEFDRSRTFLVAQHQDPLICGDRMFFSGQEFDKTLVTTRRLRQLYDNRSLIITDDPAKEEGCNHDRILERPDGTALCRKCGTILQDYDHAPDTTARPVEVPKSVTIEMDLTKSDPDTVADKPRTVARPPQKKHGRR